MTIAENILWQHLRMKQILGVTFYRQKPCLNFILDFYAHQPQLAIECDGSQHLEEEYVIADFVRDKQLENMGILVLRFDNHQIIHHISDVIEVIYDTTKLRM